MIAPDVFIPLAEEVGLIVELGRWVLTEACSAARRLPDDIKVAVNLSPVQFARTNVAEMALRALVETGLSADRLEFEITEGVLLEDTDQNLDMLRQIKHAGISIALDDFGVGYSSLAYLTVFPFDKVKIDRSFVAKVDRSETQAVVSSIVQLCRSLNLQLVAEGIETEEQVDLVTALGIEFGQGYYFSRPLPFREIAELLRSKHATRGGKPIAAFLPLRPGPELESNPR
jgi:EAL domain-containing protein (putative c-di-GMP-specific phosphodiesterase class I)